MKTLKLDNPLSKLTLGNVENDTFLAVTDTNGAGAISLSRENLIDLSEWIESRLEELELRKKARAI
jgi:hypothetical protein